MATIVSRRLWQKCSHPGYQGAGACREFTSSVMLFSGHNRWSTIRHDKAKNDKAKSKERQVVVKDLSSATQMWGPDPKFNPRLTLALTNAKRAEIPKSVIEAAIARGQGLSVMGQALEHLTIEAILPSSVAAVIECETDQKGRTLQDVRRAIKDVEGNITPTTYLFEKKGRVVFEGTNGLNVDDYFDQAIEAGAADLVTDEEGRLVILTEPAETKRVGEAFSQLSGLVIQGLEIIWDPNKDTLVDLDEEDARSLEDGLNYIREDPSVRDIYLNTAKKL